MIPTAIACQKVGMSIVASYIVEKLLRMEKMFVVRRARTKTLSFMGDSMRRGKVRQGSDGAKGKCDSGELLKLRWLGGIGATPRGSRA